MLQFSWPDPRLEAFPRLPLSFPRFWLSEADPPQGGSAARNTYSEAHHNDDMRTDRQRARAALAYANSSQIHSRRLTSAGVRGGGGGRGVEQRLLREREPIPASTGINANRRQIATVDWPFRCKQFTTSREIRHIGISG